MNMYQLLERTAETWPNNLFLVRENVTFKEFIELVKARAASLHDAGVKPGDVVGVLAHNIPEFPTTLFAIWYLGGTALLLDTNLTPFEYDNMTATTDCHLVCAEKSFFYKTKNFKFYDITAKDGKINPELKPANLESLDVATLSFTSGSTGVPKVVPLTHFNLIECANSLEDMNEWIKPGFIMYGFLPMYHPTRWRKIGLGAVVRKVQQPVLAVFGGRANLLIAGGAATKPEVETFYERLGLTFIQGYGLTETVGPICISKPTKKRFPFAFGGPTTNNECEIRDKNEDGVGVLWVRGHQVFGGYLNNAAVNSEVFDERGFFNTGDMVTMDKNGELHFAGRKKQVIVLDSGKNVYPDELEALFMEIPGVKNVAVFEHKVKNKTVTYGVFSVEPDMTIEKLSAAVAQANKKVASYKWVTHFAMTTDDLPTTSTQKVKHHVVRQNLMAGKYPIRHE